MPLNWYCIGWWFEDSVSSLFSLHVYGSAEIRVTAERAYSNSVSMSTEGLPSLSLNLVLSLLPLSVAPPSLVLWLQPDGFLCCPFLILHTQWPDSISLPPKYLSVYWPFCCQSYFCLFFWIVAIASWSSYFHSCHPSAPSCPYQGIQIGLSEHKSDNTIPQFEAVLQRSFAPKKAHRASPELPPPPSVSHIHTVGRSICIVLLWFSAQPLSHLIILAAFNCFVPHEMAEPNCEVFQPLVLLPSRPPKLSKTIE